MMRRSFESYRALTTIACLVLGVTGGCQSAPTSTTRPYEAPPRVIAPDGDWQFKSYRTTPPTAQPSPTATPSAAPRR